MGNISIINLLKTSLALDVLIVMSIVTVAFAIERWWYFKKTSCNVSQFLKSLRDKITGRDLQGAIRVCRMNKAPVARVAETVLTNASLPRRELDRVADTSKEIEGVEMERNLIVLGTMSNTAPLMGLFGTVVGIIRSFRDIAVTGSGGSSVIAMGVSEALLTTAVGIVIAVVATLFYNACIRRIRVRSVEMEDAHQELVTMLAAERQSAAATRRNSEIHVLKKAA